MGVHADDLFKFERRNFTYPDHDGLTNLQEYPQNKDQTKSDNIQDDDDVTGDELPEDTEAPDDPIASIKR